MQNYPGSDLVLADCVRFAPNGSGPKGSQCARINRTCFWPVLPRGSGQDANLIRHVYWAYIARRRFTVFPEIVNVCLLYTRRRYCLSNIYQERLLSVYFNFYEPVTATVCFTLSVCLLYTWKGCCLYHIS